MIRKFFSFIFRLLILALVIGIPGGWMIHRSYNDPEVHYFYTKEAEGEEALRFVVISDLYGYVFGHFAGCHPDWRQHDHGRRK